MINNITIAMPYYEAPEMLRTHLRYWQDYPKEGVEVIIVDDGSPNFPASTVFKEQGLPDFPVHLFRVDENIPWNHAGARNLAMHQAEGGWVLLTDIDHVLMDWTVDKFLNSSLDSSKVYQPHRYAKTMHHAHMGIKRHSDTYIITRELFWDIGGYDEKLTGFWNGPFFPFRKELKRKSELLNLDTVCLLRYSDDSVKDANVTQWGRGGSEYDIRMNSAMLKLQKRALVKYKPEILQFKWHQVV